MHFDKIWPRCLGFYPGNRHPNYAYVKESLDVVGNVGDGVDFVLPMDISFGHRAAAGQAKLLTDMLTSVVLHQLAHVFVVAESKVL